MLIKAEQRNSRQSPRKVRLVMNAVKGMSIPMAIDQLSIMEKKASKVVLQVMYQALANAKNNLGLNTDDLEIHEMLANTGATYRRFRAVSRGRGHSIQKKTTHVRIVLKTKEAVKEIKKDSKQIKADNKQTKKEVKVDSKVEKKKTPKKVESKKMIADKKPVKGVVKSANNAKRTVKKINNY